MGIACSKYTKTKCGGSKKRKHIIFIKIRHVLHAQFYT